MKGAAPPQGQPTRAASPAPSPALALCPESAAEFGRRGSLAWCFGGALRGTARGAAFVSWAQASFGQVQCLDTMDLLVSGGFLGLQQLIWPLPVQEPLVLGGWSLGARPARHLAEVFERMGGAVRILFTLDERAPQSAAL
ncbi:unnamed protein product [Durusdinium trenchii]|uniref:Uncharacterized protein n=1 Tax=Durusdinium trenchii TaxID=1381693 RepID=A0ABP0HHR2_9DINO